MFHFICREALLNMNRWWTNDSVTNSSTGSGTLKSAWHFDNLILWGDLLLSVISLVVVTAIMFLQLTFLLVCVWLFCKCWYISWWSKRKVISTYDNFGFKPLEEMY
jgi:hypothetical protein